MPIQQHCAILYSRRENPSRAFHLHTGMWLFETRILALEREFYALRRKLGRLSRQIRYKPRSLKRSAVRSQLDLVKAQTGILKEETAFYVKLGQLYDYAQFHQEFVELLKCLDTEMVETVFNEMEKAAQGISTRKK